MSRTIKGSKGPGWEPWSNREERQREHADVSLREYLDAERESEKYSDHILNEEAEEAIYCHLYGPCKRCISKTE